MQCRLLLRALLDAELASGPAHLPRAALQEPRALLRAVTRAALGQL
jgi:hypothetical protein